jgi:hypothetical protein
MKENIIELIIEELIFLGYECPQIEIYTEHENFYKVIFKSGGRKCVEYIVL